MTELGAGPVITDRVAAGRPVLGICVGAQILFARGEEHGEVTPGLGLLPGAVIRLAARRVPHMGWNTVTAPAGSALFSGLPPDPRFYFVNSYAARPTPELAATGRRWPWPTTVKFVAAVGGCAAPPVPPESPVRPAPPCRAWVTTLAGPTA